MSLRSRSKTEKWRRIRTASAALFAERGFEDTTIRAIAQRASVSVGTVMLYGKTKQDLLFRVFDEQIAPAFEQAISEAPTGCWVTDVSSVFTALIVEYRRDLRLARAIVKELPFLEGAPGAAHGRRFDQLMGYLVEITLSAQTRGELRADVSARVIAQHTFSLYYGVLVGLVMNLLPESQAAEQLCLALRLQVAGLNPQTRGGP